MSHELTINSLGLAEMAYAASGGTPWHDLGQALPSGASLEEWQTAAGMDWKIYRSVVRFATERGEAPGFADFPSNHVLFRSDNKLPLSIVSDKYQIVQPKAVLEFFRDLTESMGFALETAGTLFDGRKFWALARITEDLPVLDLKDKIGGFLLLSTSCDGSMATEARFTTVRVVCNNTLRMAGREAARVSVSHRSKWDPKAVKASLGLSLALEQFADQLAIFRKLAEVKLSPKELALTTARILSPDVDATYDSAQIKEILDSRPGSSILHLACGGAIGSDLDGTFGTAWGLLNAVTEFVDYSAPARSTNNRLNSAWFGAGDKLKDKALGLLTKEYALA